MGEKREKMSLRERKRKGKMKGGTLPHWDSAQALFQKFRKAETDGVKTQEKHNAICDHSRPFLVHVSDPRQLKILAIRFGRIQISMKYLSVNRNHPTVSN